MRCGRTLVTAFTPETDSVGRFRQRGRWEHTVRFSARSVTHRLNRGNRGPPGPTEVWPKKPCWDFGQSKKCHSSWLTPCFYGNTGECLQRPHARWYLRCCCQSPSLLPREIYPPAACSVPTRASLFGSLPLNTKLCTFHGIPKIITL